MWSSTATSACAHSKALKVDTLRATCWDLAGRGVAAREVDACGGGDGRWSRRGCSRSCTSDSRSRRRSWRGASTRALAGFAVGWRWCKSCRRRCRSGCAGGDCRARGDEIHGAFGRAPIVATPSSWSRPSRPTAIEPPDRGTVWRVVVGERQDPRAAPGRPLALPARAGGSPARAGVDKSPAQQLLWTRATWAAYRRRAADACSRGRTRALRPERAELRQRASTKSRHRSPVPQLATRREPMIHRTFAPPSSRCAKAAKARVTSPGRSRCRVGRCATCSAAAAPRCRRLCARERARARGETDPRAAHARARATWCASTRSSSRRRPLSYPALTAFCRRHGIGHEPPEPAGRYHFEPARRCSTTPRRTGSDDRRRRARACRRRRSCCCYSRMLFFQLYPTLHAFRVQGCS